MEWKIFCEDTIERTVVNSCFAESGSQTYLQWLLSAWSNTVLVALVALLIALIIGTLIGVLRTLPNSPWLVRLATYWVDFFRSIPLLVQILIWYHVVPFIFPPFASVSKLLLVMVGLGIFTSVRIAEQVRAGIESLPRGQRYASLALGFTGFQTYRYVILPLAFRIIIPPLTSEAMNVFKNSSVAYAVSVVELTFFAQQVAEETSRGIEIYIGVTVCYVISALIINQLMKLVERKFTVPGLKPVGGGH